MTVKKTLSIFLMLFLLIGCGSRKEGDSNKYNINESTIRYVTTPSQDYIVSVLSKIDLIDGYESVTEKNDPNGKLNEDGGYYSAVFFTSNLLDYDTKKSAVENSTDGGGCVECYKTEEDAIAREKHLGKFKASGGHVRLGTIIVRTSAKLDDDNQSLLEEKICNALLEGNGFTLFDENNEQTYYVYPDNGNSANNKDDREYTLEGIENNSSFGYKSLEKLIVKFVNNINENSESKIVKVDFKNNHTKATLHFDDGYTYTVWDQTNNKQVEPDFMIETQFGNGKAKVDDYDTIVSTMIFVLTGGYDMEKITSIIEEAKEFGTYKDELIGIEYKYSEEAIGYQSADHYFINIDAFNYK